MQTFLEEPPRAKENQKEEDPRHERARVIADCGDVLKVLSLLEGEGLLTREVDRVKHNPDYALLLGEEWMSEREWQLFTVLELYHRETARHCYNTFRLVKEKIEGELRKPDNTAIHLLDIITHEGVPVASPTLLRAALLHDIGKTILPRFVMESDKKKTKPLATVCKNEEQRETLRARGFDLDAPLFDVFTKHETASATILTRAGFFEEAQIAGSHHNYEGKKRNETEARDALYIGAKESGLVLGDIIHLADVEEALMSIERAYNNNKGVPLVVALAILTKDAMGNKISRFLTYLWVKSEFVKLGTSFATEEEKEAKETIDAFLKDTEEKYPAPLQRAA